MDDLFTKLQRLSINGQKLPCVKMTLGFENRLGIYSSAYRDGALLDSLGADNKLYSYVIPFRENLTNYKNLFTVELPKFDKAIKTQDNLTLIDPIDGEAQVKLKSYSREAIPQAGRDGVDVVVSFIESPTEKIAESSLPNLAKSAAAVNTSLLALPTNPSNIKSLRLDELIIVGLSQAVLYKNLYVNKISAAIAQVTKILNLLDELFQKEPLSQPVYFPLYRDCQKYLQAAYIILDAQQLPSVRTIRQYTTKAQHSLIQLAKILDNTQDDLLSLNNNVGRVLTIPKSTKVYYYAS